MAAGKKFDVFLSHNSKDKQWVIQLKNSLEARGINVWFDSDDIRPGDRFAEALEKGIEESKAVALIISPDSMRSGWVKEEYYRALSLAVNGKLQLIPVFYKNARVPSFLEDRDRVNFSDPTHYEESINELIFGITGKRPVTPSSQPTVPQKPASTSVPTNPSQNGETPENTITHVGPINEPVDTLLERIVQFSLSTAVLIGLILIIRFGISLKLFGPGGINDLINASSEPRLALWLVSIAFGSFIITLPRIGIKSEWAETFSKISHFLFTYLVGLSPWITIPIFASAVVGLVLFRPVCQSPTALIQVRLDNNDTFEYQGKPIEARSGETIFLNVVSNDDDVIFCSWTSTGPAISSVGSPSHCNTQVRLAGEAGKGIVTLSLSKSSCSAVTTTPLQIITVP
ncbi:MAG: toll/interleukin-1 receptor domain-containing protein [Anaerolineales bacterium]